ncbi:hypothetical protein BD779DRAFT_351072 [Infundibulicybe gibba]|nr:hypothetical protein BD779DRAFT_351072 [Infundibulicybe gibba]
MAILDLILFLKFTSCIHNGLQVALTIYEPALSPSPTLVSPCSASHAPDSMHPVLLAPAHSFQSTPILSRLLCRLSAVA